MRQHFLSRALRHFTQNMKLLTNVVRLHVTAEFDFFATGCFVSINIKFTILFQLTCQLAMKYKASSQATFAIYQRVACQFYHSTKTVFPLNLPHTSRVFIRGCQVCTFTLKNQLVKVPLFVQLNAFSSAVRFLS